MKIHLAESEEWGKIGEKFKEQYRRKIAKEYKACSKLLPFGSTYINFFVQPRRYGLIEETHDSARTYNSEFIEIAFDPDFAATNPKQSLDQVMASVYHEMNHAARFNLGIWHRSFLDGAIMEGLATVFEREYIKTKPLWADYPVEVSDWIKEIQKQGESIVYQDYMFKHPDGRKWIGYKAGAYIVDEAIRLSSKSVIELTQLECCEILKLAKINV